MLVNGAATGITEPADRELLWDSVLRSLASGQQQPFPVPLANGRQIVIRCEPVLDGIRLVGVLIRPRTATARTHGAPPRRGATTPAYGWSSLTDTEVAVAEQVAQGLTNREAAAHLYLSPHTIDYHLRQVFQKLDVRSRVELPGPYSGGRPNCHAEPACRHAPAGTVITAVPEQNSAATGYGMTSRAIAWPGRMAGQDERW